MINAYAEALRRRNLIKRRNRVIDGLLTSVYSQAIVAGAPFELARRDSETDEQHAVRELIAHNQRLTASLLTITLMVRNELSARGLMDQVPQRGPDKISVDEHGTITATMRRPLVDDPD